MEREFSDLNDTEILHEFFSNHKADLTQYGDRRYTIEEAIVKTQDEAFKLEQELYELAEYGQIIRGSTSKHCFNP